MKFAYARLVTADVSVLAHFYAAILDVAPLGTDEYAELQTEGRVLAIVSQRSIDIFSAGAAESAANQSVILDFQVDDVDRHRSRLEGIVSIVLEPTDQPWGNRSMLFRDPDGNLINFYTPLDVLPRAPNNNLYPVSGQRSID
jgi:catechol 2,3-dioxygenase-like lactoylglutathione lyase family enzyme